MTDETYQGWTNCETWCVALWLNNEQSLQEGARCFCNQPGEMLQEATQTLSDYVEEMIDDGVFGGSPSGLVMDLINCARARVNWVEIATTFREEGA